MKDCLFNFFRISILVLFLPFVSAFGQNCEAPAFAEAGQITGTTAVLFWVDFNGNTQWDVVVSTSPLEDPSSHPDIRRVTGEGSVIEYPVDGLSPEMDYYFYVRSVCGATQTSNWMSGTAFHTLCADKSVPYSCDFSGSQLPSCWNVVSGYPSLTSADAAHPSVLLLPAYAQIALPSFNLPLSSLMVSFYIRSSDNSSPFELGVITDVGDVQTYETVENLSIASSNSFFAKQVWLNSYAGEAKYIVLSNMGDADCYIDDLTVSIISDCASPANVEAQDITSTSAVIRWNELGTAVHWQGILSTTPVTNFNAYTPQIHTDSSCVLSSLSPNTSYYYYVRSVCGSDYSDWSSTYFTTFCASSTLPTTESFSSQLPACWASERVSGNAEVRFVTSGNDPTCTPAGGNYMVKWESAVNNSGYQARLVSKPLSTVGVNVLNVRFMWHHDLQNPNVQNDGVQVQYSFDGITWENTPQGMIHRCDGTHSGWTEYNVSAPAAGGQSLVFVGFLFSSGRGGNCYLDEVTFESASGCLPPANVAVSNVGGNSATISWNETGGATNWNIIVSETPVSNFAGITPIATTTTPTLIDNLNPNTTYYAYVQSKCSANSFSEWVMAPAFTTGCGDVLVLPFEESFERYGTCSNAFPPCWNRYGLPDFGTFFHDGQNCVTPSATDMDAADGEKSLLVCTPSGGRSYVVSPAIRENIRDLAVTFYLKKSSATASGIFEVGVMTAAADPATFESIATIELDHEGEWFYCPVSFENAAAYGSDKFIVFRHIGAADDSYYLIDDVTIIVRPDCWATDHVNVSNVDGNHATFQWGDPNDPSAQWHLKISDTPMSNMAQTANVFDQVLTETSLAIDYLQGGTTYYYYLQSDCGNNALGSWVSGSFSTLPCNCYVDICMRDQWANGWEGAKIQLKHGSTVFAEVTMANNGVYDTARVYTCEAINIDYWFVSGSYDPDITFSIINSLGTTIYTSSGTPQAGCFLSAVPACGVSCGTAPANLSATTTATGNQLTWAAAPEALCYTVYRDGMELDDYVYGLSYLDASGSANSCYTVTAQCVVGESGHSNQSCVTGIEERDGRHDIHIFPNPAKDRFTIATDFQFSRISVTNLLGQEVFTTETKGNRMDIGTDGLPAGLYLVKVYDGKAWLTRKVVIE